MVAIICLLMFVANVPGFWLPPSCVTGTPTEVPRIGDYALWSAIWLDDAMTEPDSQGVPCMRCLVYRVALSTPDKCEARAGILTFNSAIEPQDLCHRSSVIMLDELGRTRAVQKLLASSASDRLEALLPRLPQARRMGYCRGFLDASPDGRRVLTWMGTDSGGTPTLALSDTEGSQVISTREFSAAVGVWIGWIQSEELMAYILDVRYGDTGVESGELHALTLDGAWRKTRVQATALTAAPDGSSILLYRWMFRGGFEIERRSANLSAIKWKQVSELHGASGVSIQGLWWSTDQRLVCVPIVLPSEPPRCEEESHNEWVDLLFFAAADGSFLGSVKLLVNLDERAPSENDSRSPGYGRTLPAGLLGPETVIAPASQKLDVRKAFGVTLVKDAGQSTEAEDVR